MILEKYGSFEAEEFEAEYDPKEESRHIYSVAPPDRLGGVGHAVIRQNGEVISVWMEDR